MSQKFPLDLSKFKKAHEDEHKATLSHPDGHHIVIAKKALSPKMRDQIAKLPKMADGGMMQPPADGKKSIGDLINYPKKAEGGYVQEGADAVDDYAAKKQAMMAEGGDVDKIIARKAAIDKENKENMEYGADLKEYPADVNELMKKTDVTPRKMADGGWATPVLKEKYDDEYPTDGLNQTYPDKGVKKMADGGLAEQRQKRLGEFSKGFNARLEHEPAKKYAPPAAEEKPINTAEAADIGHRQTEQEYQQRTGKKSPWAGYADGGEVEDAPEEKPQAPVNINIGTPQTAAQPPQIPASAAQNQTPQQPPVDPNLTAASQQLASMAPKMPQEGTPAAQQPELGTEGEQPPVAAPDVMEAYSKQVQGINQGAETTAQQAESDKRAIKANIDAQQQLLGSYNDHLQNLRDERKNFIDDIQAGHVDPEKYWENHSKIGAGIGLILAGFNPTARPNAALDFLNKQMEENLRAQQENLNSSHNLLNANMKQFGNERDALDMTKVMQADMLANRLRISAANATSPMAKANALQMAGKLEAEYAPVFQQMVMRRSLSQAGSEQDPAAAVPLMVPKEHQEAVYKEVERAQDTRRMSDAILKSFDQAAKDVRPFSGGRLKNVLPFTESAYVGALHQAMQPTFKDLEGTVRQAAMDNTFKNITPRMGNSDQEIAEKRQSLVDYLKSKTSAPRAKSFGIDLDKFASTSSDRSKSLPPEQQRLVQLARQNPDNPKAQLYLKKLGLQ